MADIFKKKERSAIMSKVRSKGNKSTEQRLIELFSAYSIKGWRRNYKVKGNPDFVFLKKRIAIFVDGCFWHGHDCRNTHPKDNESYWIQKLERNMRRDKEVTSLFQSRGWIVVRIWECDLKKTKQDETLKMLKSILKL